MCECHLCTTGRRLKEIRAKLPPDDAEWLQGFGESFLSVSRDEQYYRSIVTGDWPGSVAIMERCLERAKKNITAP